jgi:hypothetical protein
LAVYLGVYAFVLHLLKVAHLPNEAIGKERRGRSA